jgi:hypothetical protein
MGGHVYVLLPLLITVMVKELRLKSSKHCISSNMLMFLMLNQKMQLLDYSLMKYIMHPLLRIK